MYCLGKDNGENIMKSIKEGPFQMGTVSDVIAGGTEGAVQQGPVRARVLNDLSAEEKERCLLASLQAPFLKEKKGYFMSYHHYSSSSSVKRFSVSGDMLLIPSFLIKKLNLSLGNGLGKCQLFDIRPNKVKFHYFILHLILYKMVAYINVLCS
ncbi:hypothetical protein Tco_0739598 [Tanacetum coccineum]